MLGSYAGGSVVRTLVYQHLRSFIKSESYSRKVPNASVGVVSPICLNERVSHV